MPYVLLDGQSYPLAAGDNVVGGVSDAHVRIAGAGAPVPDIAAVVAVADDGTAVIRRGNDGAVKVNGVQLGVEPSPLIHGDKIEVAGRELFFGDDRKGGNTQYVQSVRLPGVAGAGAGGAAGGARRAAAARGGRLVSLVDGREYLVSERGLVLGRDPSCDVVIPGGGVSRKHATIAPENDGYRLTDTSTNGVLVNGERIAMPTLLARGDLVSIGGEEFRFYADEAPAAPAAAAAAAAAGAPTGPVLARLECVSTGVLRGLAFELRSPVVHVGRGTQNDVVVPDESVSDQHASIRRLGAAWYVVDVDSTNGTYVGGERITGQAPLIEGSDVRFGGVKFIFHPSEAGNAVAGVADGRAVEGEDRGGGGGGGRAAGAGQTRVIAAPRPVPHGAGAPQPPAHQTAAPVARPAGASADAAKSAGAAQGSHRTLILIGIVVVALAAAGAFILFTSR
jgi:pSer/pThr/pTyr-binding forkhead associated (FHA) protein